MSVHIHSSWQGRPEELAFKLKKVVTEWGDETGHTVRDELKEATPVRTGALQASERYSRTSAGLTTRLEWSAHRLYAPFVIKGTKPHEIRPVAARSLRWVGAGGVHFAKVVHHPGTKANDFPRRVLDEVKDEVITNLANKIQAALNGEDHA
jgi:hypothetical protein